LDAPEVTWYWPTAHFVETLSPEAASMDPALEITQLVEPVVDA